MSQLVNCQPTTTGWRLRPGYLSEHGSSQESVHILLGRFLADHQAKSALASRSLFADNEAFRWGRGKPLEKVLTCKEDLLFLMQNPQLYRNAITIIEPWEHVGFNHLDEDVRASVNVAFIAQKVADCDTILYPAWSTGPLDPDLIVPVISSGLAVVVEGGDPSVRDAGSFAGSKTSLDELSLLVEKLLLARSQTSAPAILICLGHQLAAQCHIRLIRKAVNAVLKLESLSSDPDGKALRALKKTCDQIRSVGACFRVAKKNGRVVAESWTDPDFAVGSNESKEIGERHLQHYHCPDLDATRIPLEVIRAHELTAHEFVGVIDTMIEYEKDVNIAMFHSDEVNEEAVLFANWAYRLIHETIIPHRAAVAVGPLSWLTQLPYAIEILCSTAIDDEVVTECSATCILYKGFESRRIRRSFTCQFHPELLSDLRIVGVRQPPTYDRLKKDDGVRLFVRLLYEGMQE